MVLHGFLGMNLTEFLGSVFAGILAAFISYGVFGLIDFCDKYKFKRVFSLNKNRRCLIVFPIYPEDNPIEDSTRYKNLFGVGHITHATSRLGVDAELIRSNKKESVYHERGDIIAIGGPKSNHFTKDLLNEYKDLNFEWKGEDSMAASYQDSSENQRFSFNGKRYELTEKTEPALIIKKTKKDTKDERTIILLIGLTGQGTAGAAHYLLNEYKRIHKEFQNKSFSIKINVPRSDAGVLRSYKGYDKDFEDLTENKKQNKWKEKTKRFISCLKTINTSR